MRDTTEPLPLRTARRLCAGMALLYRSTNACSAQEASAFLDDALQDAWRDRRWRGLTRVLALAGADLVRARFGRAALPVTERPRSFDVQTLRASFMDRLIADLRYSIRTLVRTPAFTAVAVITLALGIGATTAVYAVVDGVLLRPFTYPYMDRLAILMEAGRERPGDVGRVAEPGGLARAERGLRRAGHLPEHAGRPGRRRCARTAQRQPGVLVDLCVDGHRAAHRPHVQRERRWAWGRTSGDHQRAPVARPVWRPARHRRAAGHAQQSAVHHRRRDARRHAISGAHDRCLAAARPVRRHLSAAGRASRADWGGPAQARHRHRARAQLDGGDRQPAERAISRLQQGQHALRSIRITSSSFRTSVRCCGCCSGLSVCSC